MCGIVGYAGKRDCIEVLLGSLKKLEYRGYDSAGVAYIKDSKLELCKRKGKLAELESAIEGASAPDTVVEVARVGQVPRISTSTGFSLMIPLVKLSSLFITSPPLPLFCRP